MTEKLLFGFVERFVRDDGVIPMRENKMWFEINKSLLFTGNMIASFILKSEYVKALLDTKRAHLTVYRQGHIFKRFPYPFLKK